MTERHLDAGTAPLDPGTDQVARARARFLSTIAGSRPAGALRERVQALLDRSPRALESLLELMILTQSDSRAADRLAGVITRFDQHVSERLDQLAEANPLLRFDSIEDAIASRGYREVHCWAVTAAVLCAWLPGLSNRAAWRHWQHGTATGVLTLLASSAAQRDHAFTAGVLHGIGRLAMPGDAATPLQEAAEQATSPSRGESGDADFTEREAARAIAEAACWPEAIAGALVPCATREEDLDGLPSTIARACETAAALGFDDGRLRPMEREPVAEQLLVARLERLGGVPYLRSLVEMFPSS